MINKVEELEVTTYLGNSRESIRKKVELLVEELPAGIEKARSGDAEAAAVYLSATYKVLSSALEEEAIAFEKYLDESPSQSTHEASRKDKKTHP
ncbi:hypothetical protein M3557_04865 [Bhargavaea ginsengi]|uniref:hypothetical protein n=1 Tax=Bhargavaea ginsengi TaxID=426757 RepID=UPI00203AFF79|nr:hypothetical protein [Bhargavaea ginsengi]MCM3087239.1 hypothetical protein [Bhargavaea ginsengi]